MNTSNSCTGRGVHLQIRRDHPRRGADGADACHREWWQGAGHHPLRDGRAGRCDLLVENEILVELKAVKALDNVHMAQCMNYLKATGLQVCLLINFGSPRIEVKRVLNGLLKSKPENLCNSDE